VAVTRIPPQFLIVGFPSVNSYSCRHCCRRRHRSAAGKT